MGDCMLNIIYLRKKSICTVIKTLEIVYFKEFKLFTYYINDQKDKLDYKKEKAP
jgi:hypothetical protein